MAPLPFGLGGPLGLKITSKKEGSVKYSALSVNILKEPKFYYKKSNGLCDLTGGVTSGYDPTRTQVRHGSILFKLINLIQTLRLHNRFVFK